MGPESIEVVRRVYVAWQEGDLEELLSLVDRDNAGASRYRDGEYEAKGWSGGLPSNIDVALTLRAGRITDVQVTPNATDPTSLDYQERFADAVPAVVVGKRIDEVRVSRLAGSSGTPDGFNDAIEKIKAEASR